ncbi:MAG: tetratricopeptide repeat protein [Chloroflexota bacterium]
MSGEALYERYKEALKRGHVASLRGRLEDALTAYAEAASIAPERSTPHASAGTALLRRKRPADALRHYGVALQLSPRDEAALLGRAQALAALGRPGEAADAYDALSEARLSGGKLADAVDAARRALELAEGRERRRTLARLIGELRASEPGEPGRAALEQALGVLDGMAMPSMAPARPSRSKGTPPAAGEAGPAADEGVEAGPAADETEAAPEVPEAEETAPAVPAIRAALDRDLLEDVDADTLARAADAEIDAGDMAAALGHLLDLAATHRRQGSAEAAIDACYVGLSLRPDDVDLHLALVELYDDRGWTVLAAEKLDLLERIATLDEDADATARVAAARTRPG